MLKTGHTGAISHKGGCDPAPVGIIAGATAARAIGPLSTQQLPGSRLEAVGGRALHQVPQALPYHSPSALRRVLAAELAPAGQATTKGG